MQTSIAVGKDPNLIRVLGRLSRVMQGKQELIFLFIDTLIRHDLGKPSFDTNTSFFYMLLKL